MFNAIVVLPLSAKIVAGTLLARRARRKLSPMPGPRVTRVRVLLDPGARI
jgi:hypothetical protein